ncbi:MAG: hypothetical protein HYZ42_11435 [Bacteroidetes bacterium]|nr:hypothetical protein [Bacteroidota bacterium]
MGIADRPNTKFPTENQAITFYWGELNDGWLVIHSAIPDGNNARWVLKYNAEYGEGSFAIIFPHF